MHVALPCTCCAGRAITVRCRLTIARHLIWLIRCCVSSFVVFGCHCFAPSCPSHLSTSAPNLCLSARAPSLCILISSDNIHTFIICQEVDKYDQRLKVALKRSDDSRTKFVSLKLLLEESRVGIAKFLTLLEGQAGQSGPGRSPTVALPSIPAIPEALSEVETKIAGILDAVRLVIQDDSSSKRGYSNSMVRWCRHTLLWQDA